MRARKAVEFILRLFLLTGLIMPAAADAQDTVNTALVERYISPGKLHYCCIPVSSTYSKVFSRFSVQYYAEPLHHWKTVSVHSDSILNTAMLGYSVLSSGSTTDSNIVDYVGTMNTGGYAIILSRTWNPLLNPPAFDGWNLAGNLYPSASDFESTAWFLQNVDPTIYFFDGINYKPYNRVDHIGNGSGIIPSNQGFFVHVSSGTTGAMSVDNSTRLHSLQPYYKNGAVLEDILTLEAQGNGYSDETFIHLDSSASSHFDGQTDAYKLFGIAAAPQIYSLIADTVASINVLPYSGPNDTVPVGFKVGVAGNYQIIGHGMGSFTYVLSVYLKDLKLNTLQNLMTDSVYSFSANPSDNPDRFMLYFNFYPAGISGTNDNAGLIIYSSDDDVFVKNLGNQNASGDVYIYDLTGRQVFKDRLQNIQLNKFRVGLPAGYFLVRVIAHDNSIIRKVFLQ